MKKEDPLDRVERRLRQYLIRGYRHRGLIRRKENEGLRTLLESYKQYEEALRKPDTETRKSGSHSE